MQVLPNAAQGRDYTNVQSRQSIRIAHARDHQQLRRVDRAAAQDHLAPRTRALRAAFLQVLHAHGLGLALAVFKQDACGHAVLVQYEVFAFKRRAQVGHGRAPAPTFVGGHVHRPQAFLLVAVHVFGERVTGLLTRVDEGAVQRVFAGAGAHVQRAGIAPVRVTSDGAGLGFFEVGQTLGVRPLFHARRAGPRFVVHGVAAHIGHAVDGR